MEISPITRALSVRQPFAELILNGSKKFEYRSTPTNIRERVYIYAALTPKDSPKDWKKAGKSPGELPAGVIVGTVEIVDCKPDQEWGFAYTLSKPKRFKKYLTASNSALPKFWIPRFK